LTNHDSNTDSLTGHGIEADRWWLLSTVDTAVVKLRYRAMFRTTSPDPFRAVLDVANEVPTLCAEIDRLSRLLGQARLAYANLTAACRATLAAWAEGEPDPWWYLRDELANTTDPDSSGGGELG
jgi:hypothetical protein